MRELILEHPGESRVLLVVPNGNDDGGERAGVQRPAGEPRGVGCDRTAPTAGFGLPSSV